MAPTKVTLAWGTAAVAAVALLAAPDGVTAAPKRQRKDLSTWLACARSCANIAGGADDGDCISCLRAALDGEVGEVGAHGLPATYAMDMLSLKLPGSTYTKAWCDSETARGCSTKANFPGIGTTSFMRHDDVVARGSDLPRRQNSGEVWRGSELGFIITNPYFWQDVDPEGLVLGATVEQHKVMRPIIDGIFGAEAGAQWDSAAVKASVQGFLQARAAQGTLHVQNDIKAWIHQLLYKIAFGEDITFGEALEFVAVQGKLTTFTTIAQLFPAEVFDQEEIFGANVKAQIYDTLGAKQIRDDLKGYFDRYLPKVQRKYHAVLQGHDCGGTASCAHQLASALLDTFTTAGGLSVPGGIATALGVLYSTHDSNPGRGVGYSRGSTGDNGPEALFYESMRMFAPVVGFPYWTTRPSPERTEYTCDTSRPVSDPRRYCLNQYKNGVREVLNLALAQRDADVWGADHERFTLKPLSAYHSKFVGFAEMAEDASVAGGAMSRNCPAKQLAMKIGIEFFRAFKTEDWKLSPAQAAIQFSGSTPFVDEFILYPQATACAFSCSTWDASCNWLAYKCSTCNTCAGYSGSCRWWDWGCKLKRAQCIIC